MIYKSTRIAKFKDWELSKGDIGYIKDKDLPHNIYDIRFPLSKVIYWGIFGGDIDDDGEFYKGYKNETLVEVNIEGFGNMVLIDELYKLDKSMQEYYSKTTLLFKAQ